MQQSGHANSPRPAASARPLAPASPAGSSSSRVTPLRRLPPKRAASERSCIVCHRRKVRCDKTVPCANCTRSGVLCCYPSGKKTPRQPKTTIADIASRLVQLERTIVAVAGGDDSGGDDGGGAGAAVALERRGAASRGGVPLPSLSTVFSAASYNDAQRSRLGTPHSSSGAGGGDDDSVHAAHDDAAIEGGAAAEEILLKNAYASRYINEVLLSRVLEEEQEIRFALTSPDGSERRGDDDYDDTPEANEPAITLFGTLTGGLYTTRLPTWSGTISTTSAGLHPPKRHALQLWHAYLQNVEPVNKMLHVPTAEVDVFTAIHSPGSTDPAFESLLFSIYYAAVTCYQPEEYRASFGEDKAAALDRYRAGMDRALTQARFLESPNLPTLQALTLFLRTSRAHSPGRSIWILFGMVLRAAQSIGLHRDGANFNLPPFEAEIRRRLWCHMVAQDCRAAEDYGIDITPFDGGDHIQVALNINDSEMHPDMAALPAPQMRWTEMTLAVCMRHLGLTMAYIMRRLAAMRAQAAGAAATSAAAAATTMGPSSQSPSVPLPPLTEARRRAIMKERNAYVEELLRQCNPVVPIQRMTLKMVRIVQLKFDFISRLQLAMISVASSKRTLATEENLIEACEVIELNADFMADEMMQNFRWSAELYPPYHTLLYLLWHLSVQHVAGGTTGSGSGSGGTSGGTSHTSACLCDRAWVAADGMFAMEKARQRRQNVRGRNAKWAVLTALRDKALRVRDEARRQRQQQEQQADETQEVPPHGHGSNSDDSNTVSDDGMRHTPSFANAVDSSTPPYDDAAQMPNHHADAFSTAGTTDASAAAAVTTATVTAVATPYSEPAAVPAPAAAELGVPPPPPPFLHPELMADTDMMEFLGDSTLGMGMDMDWVRGFMDWNAMADDFRTR